jgi:ribonuclease HII
MKKTDETNDFLSVESGLFQNERRIWGLSYEIIAGVDEAGRGPLAGPVVAAAVALASPIARFPSVFDSKQISDARRRRLRDEILAVCGVMVGVAVIDAAKIDEINILRATHLAMREALAKIAKVRFALIDGLPVPGLPCPSEAIVKGDTKSALIAAASIIAKVHRDEIMEGLALKYPLYGFEKHKGYGTAEHINALKKFGPCPIHRKTFAPVRHCYAL